MHQDLEQDFEDHHQLLFKIDFMSSKFINDF